MSKKKGSEAKHHTIVAKHPLAHDKSSWTLLIGSQKSECYITVGVVEWPGPNDTTTGKKASDSSISADVKDARKNIMENMPGKTRHGWGYYGKSGAKWHNGDHSNYGTKFKNGDKVTVTLDKAADTLSFAVNGVDQKVAYDNGFHGKKLYPVRLVARCEV